MFINFAKALFEILVSDEFFYIKRANNALMYDTEALSLYMDKGSILYVVTIVNGGIISSASYNRLVEGYSRLFDEESKAQLIHMSVIVDDKEGQLTHDEDYLPGKINYDFRYNVDLDKCTTTVPEGQPELLGIQEKIIKAFSIMDGKYVHGTHLTSFEREVSERYALPEKSKSIYLTLSLIFVNIIIWVLMEFSGGSNETWTLVSFGAVSSNLIFHLNEYYRLITAIFLHIGAAHLASNCLALYIYGSRVERIFGKPLLMVIYLLSGVVGNIVTVLFIENLSAGASGGIFGLLGALLAVSYRTGRTVLDLSPYVILMLCISSIGFGFLMPEINNYAHVAGFITGVVLGGFTFRRS